MTAKKNKIFRDPVHGYITIPEDIVSNFIDTPQFQRLGRIKQTNLNVLFPAANQTRFDHSLGVYFLGKKLFNSILEKSSSEEYFDELKSYQYTVEMACLLHDIGHAPLSHIGEPFYDKDKIRKELEAEGIKIEEDLATHELMSVLIGRKIFGSKLEDGKYDKDLFFRLITGSKLDSDGYSPPTPLKKAIKAVLSSPFDVDKMDYIMRDSASAGVPSIELDLDRIINSASLVTNPVNKELVIAFGKSGFSVVTSIINNRNYMYTWIYGHHKVQYQYQLLTKFIKQLDKNKKFSKIFSYEAITGTKVSFGGMNISYTDDYDLWHIFKNVDDLPRANFGILKDQLFYRNHYKPFWKTKIEFDQSKTQFSGKLDYIMTQLENPEEFFSKKVKPKPSSIEEDDILIFKSDPKVVFPNLSSDMYFYFDDKNTGTRVVKTYKDLFGEEKKNDPLFFIFIKKDKYNENIYKEIIKVLAEL